ncbi:ATPase [Durusdinium trenchii]|uniref:ATPase n=1 Tax=Durusdinium trenchii TaxID=1381693 RepID=A0ABP0LTX7_9DINO
MKTTDEPIIVSEAYNASASRVWRAITDVDEMRRWYIDNIPDFQAQVGFETRFLIVNEGRKFPHHWTVTGVDEGERLAYDWIIEGYPGRSTTVWELTEAGAQTKLTLDCKVLEDFPDDIPEFRRESGVEGWNFFIKERLKDYLEKPTENAETVAPAEAVDAEAVEAAPQIKTGNGVNNYIVLEEAARDGATFTFRKVAIERQGFLVFHPFENGAPVPTVYVGVEPLAAGVHEDVSITINEAPETGEMFVVMLHYDMNEDGVFDFNDGVDVPDAPVFEGDTLVALRFVAP